MEVLLSAPQAAGLAIEWLGPTYAEQELLHHYQQAALFVYPSLAERGETIGMLYVEADNVPAIRTYEGLGFDIVRTDRAWVIVS